MWFGSKSARQPRSSNKAQLGGSFGLILLRAAILLSLSATSGKAGGL
jgi:hypothetical protein